MEENLATACPLPTFAKAKGPPVGNLRGGDAGGAATANDNDTRELERHLRELVEELAPFMTGPGTGVQERVAEIHQALGGTIAAGGPASLPGAEPIVVDTDEESAPALPMTPRCQQATRQ